MKLGNNVENLEKEKNFVVSSEKLVLHSNGPPQQINLKIE
jgi:hypothetical protein